MSIFGMNAGDIILINNRTRGNLLGQKILRLKKSVNTTHIALSLGEGGFIHADKTCGVDLVFLHELITEAEGNWKVIRHSEVNDKVEKFIKNLAIFHYKKTYNKGIILRENEKSLFCSQFADVVFRNAGINIFNRGKSEGLINFKNALPVDFESLLLEVGKWSDVSDVYREILEDASIINRLEKFFLQEKFFVNITRKQHSDRHALSDITQIIKNSHDQLPSDFQDKALSEMLSENIKYLEETDSKLLYDFWDSKSKRRRKGR